MEFERNTRKRKSIIFFLFILIISLSTVPQAFGIVIIIFLIGICYLYLSDKVTQRRTLLDDAIQRLEVDKTIRDYREDEEGEYVFPVNCPNCNTHLQLNEVQWIDSRSAICPKCESIVRASIQD